MKAVIFDKDGTLMQFEPFWSAVAQCAISLLAKDLKIVQYKEALENSIGFKDGKADKGGILCAGTYGEMAQAFNSVLSGCKSLVRVTEEQVALQFERNAGAGKILPVCDNLSDVLDGLKKRGVLLFLATTDNPYVTDICLKGLGIADKFERIYTDDGKYPPKPNPKIIFEILKDYGLNADDVIMVGDTMTDVAFAENGGIKSVCVGEGEARTKADFAIKDVSYLDTVTQ